MTRQILLLYIVAGKLNTVGITPVVDLFAKAMEHQLLHGIPVTVTEGAIAFLFHKQQTQAVKNIFPVPPAEFLRHHPGVGYAPTVILRLIGKKARKAFRQLLTVTLGVFFVGLGQELVYHFSVEDICCGGGNVQIQIQAYIRGMLCHPLQLFSGKAVAEPCRIIIFPDLIGNVGIPVFFFLQELSAGKAAGPAVLVIHPRLHSLLLCLFHTGICTLHPFFRQIGCAQAAPGVHKKAADALLFHPVDLLGQYIFIKPIIP